ncbi:hypothetical protein [Pseudomonas citronellolis]|uniref:hypothetical protein n=1 Tax=Pseudomonas citronellolis TaxID=53408 RepID=UPI002D77F119|nr:hypothetical protein [Pseudomonas citronellolis]WRT85568.1 hypothetical protein VK748_14375 [Pseudomonas citronellolis]
MKKVKRNNNVSQTIRIGQFLDLGYKDYLGARVLLSSGLLLQGAILASTAVEKYLKAVLAFRGNVSHGHLQASHIRAAKNFDSRLARLLNDDFLELLRRVYAMRYVDSLSIGFNLVIAYREFIAELDYTCQMLHDSFSLNINGEEIKSSYHLDKDSGDELLWVDNFILSDVDKQEFIAALDQQIYEARVCPHRGLIEMSYVSVARVSDGKFLREGIKLMDESGCEYMMSLAPIVPGSGVLPSEK